MQQVPISQCSGAQRRGLCQPGSQTSPHSPPLSHRLRQETPAKAKENQSAEGSRVRRRRRRRRGGPKILSWILIFSSPGPLLPYTTPLPPCCWLEPTSRLALRASSHDRLDPPNPPCKRLQVRPRPLATLHPSHRCLSGLPLPRSCPRCRRHQPPSWTTTQPRGGG